MFRSIKIAVVVTLLSFFTSLAGAAELININKADALTLADNLNGIGDAKAKAIIAYRVENGDFDNVADLVNVKGIGNKLVERNRSLITVGNRSEATTTAKASAEPSTGEAIPMKPESEQPAAANQ